ncbi:MAG: ATP-grasp domain-containing protein [Planctomycetaceae bacterium]|nr:ATP-grasp domain-containing protein [Planctomycetaceae bacterium]
MRILLYEFIHAGGWRQFGWPSPPASLRREGAAMLAAVAADFRQQDDVEVLIATDPTESGGTGCLSASAFVNHQADWTLIIAPESGGALCELARRAEVASLKLLGPSSEFIQLTSDKHATAQYLAAAGVPVPRGCELAAGAPLPRDWRYPAVLKPRDGAGSQDTFLVDSYSAAEGSPTLPHNQQARRLEEYCPGQPASVALLCGPDVRLPLVPCAQRLSTDGRFTYLGGKAPLRRDLAERAVALAARALEALPPARGYVGVDLMLGAAADGSHDRVIEVNPRLTTSYVGLRALCRGNLAGAMLAAAVGTPPELSWLADKVEFDACGRVRCVRSRSQSGSQSTQ